jgi:hypothetical protein
MPKKLFDSRKSQLDLQIIVWNIADSKRGVGGGLGGLGRKGSKDDAGSRKGSRCVVEAKHAVSVWLGKLRLRVIWKCIKHVWKWNLAIRINYPALIYEFQSMYVCTR